jgi:hypothetical protein
VRRVSQGEKAAIATAPPSKGGSQQRQKPGLQQVESSAVATSTAALRPPAADLTSLHVHLRL